MTARLIDGKASAAKLRIRVTEAATALRAAHGIVPGLATVLVGEDPASSVYVKAKGRAAHEAGFKSFDIRHPATLSEEALLAQVAALNADAAVHGILVQMPLPKHIDSAKVIAAIAPLKDVDALTATNAGRLMSGEYGVDKGLVSCTPLGVMMLLAEYIGDIAGADALVIGRSLLFGKPAAQLLLAANATVTMAHSRTRDLAAVALRADILVAAIGKPEFVKGDWVKPGATVIDVGINRVEAGEGKYKLVGDVAFAEAEKTAGLITPVPGGVGAMTIICLLRNTLVAAAMQAGLEQPKI